MILFSMILATISMIICSLFLAANFLFNGITTAAHTAVGYVLVYLVLKYISKKKKVSYYFKDEFGISMCCYISLFLEGIVLMYASKFIGFQIFWNFAKYGDIVLYGAMVSSFLIAIFNANVFTVADPEESKNWN